MQALLKIETDDWVLEIAGNVPTLPPFIEVAPVTSIDVTGVARVSVFSRAHDSVQLIESGTPIAPVFFENTRYDFYLSSRSGNATLQLPPAASFRHTVGALTHYSLDFRNDVGMVEIKVKHDADVIAIRFEVFPRKIDYRTDYAYMRDEVASITRNLVLAVQARTFGLAMPFPTEQPTLPEWLSLIRYYFKKLVSTTTAISQNPHSILIQNIRSTPIERARRVDHRALDRLVRKRLPPSGIVAPGTRLPLPRRVPESLRHVTYDTPENRYVKAVLVETLRNIQRALHAQTSDNEDADLSAEQKFFDAMRPEAEAMLREVQRLLRLSFLRDVATIPAKRPSSLVFHRHPHYAAFEKIARVLNGGLSLEGGPLHIGVKDIALLYEYWCFLRLVQMLRERFELQQQSVIRLSHLKVVVVLQKGQRATIRFRDPVSGKTLFLVYNRRFTRLPTIAQRPDNIIQIASEDRLYVFDAKYRLAFDPEYQRQFDGIGPTTEDINTMHRYRDAIVIPHPTRPNAYVRGVVEGAVVLFPYPDELRYRAHKFYQSIQLVQIGGLPFLPNAVGLVEATIRDILEREGFAIPAP